MTEGPAGGYGLLPRHSMEIRKDRGAQGFVTQPMRIILFGFTEKETEQGLKKVTGRRKAAELYGRTSSLYGMITAVLETFPAADCYAFPLGEEPQEAAEPSFSVDLSGLPAEQYSHFVLPFYDRAAVTTVLDELERRWNSDEATDGHLYLADNSPADQLRLRYSNDKDRLCNSMHLTVLDCMESPLPPHIWAASLAALSALHGGTPSRPFSGLELKVKDHGLVRSREKQEREELLKAGISTIRISSGRVFPDRLVTTYSEDDGTETPDTTYRDLNARLTLSALRYDWLSYVSGLFHRCVLSQDENQAGDYVMTAKTIRGLAVARHDLWLEKLLVQDPENRFPKALRVSVAEDGEHFSLSLPVHLMGQLRGTHTILSFRRGAA